MFKQVSFHTVVASLGISPEEMTSVNATVASLLKQFGADEFLSVEEQTAEGLFNSLIGSNNPEQAVGVVKDFMDSYHESWFTRKAAQTVVGRVLSGDTQQAAHVRKVVHSIMQSPLTPDVPTEFDSMGELVHDGIVPIVDYYLQETPVSDLIDDPDILPEDDWILGG